MPVLTVLVEVRAAPGAQPAALGSAGDRRGQGERDRVARPVGHLDDAGRLFVEGRDDDMIVSGGENVFPAEVEDLLAGHPGVCEVAVAGVSDEQFGQRLKAWVVRRPGHDVDAEQLKAFVKDNLAGFKVPREVVFVEELPRTATGKVLKRELQAT